MHKKIIFIMFVLGIVFINGCVQEKLASKADSIVEMSPDLDLELSSNGELKVGDEILIKLVLTPTSAGLGKEFFDTPAKIRFSLPDSFEIIDRNPEQEIYFNDFEPRTAEIKVRPLKEGVFDVRADVEKQNSGEYWKILSTDIDSKSLIGAECKIDSDCIAGGCSGTVCQSKNAEPTFTTCEFLPEYECYNHIACGCVDGKCQWKKTKKFEECVEKARLP